MRSFSYRQIGLSLILTVTIGACATVARNDTAGAPACVPARSSVGVSTAPRWLLIQTAAALHATGSFFIGVGNVGLQATAGSEVHGSSGTLVVYLGITLVSAGSVGVGNLLISGSENLAAFAEPLAPSADDSKPCVRAP